jgi:2-iminobutanoate/2-iminopropanoate deaminase
MSKKAMTSSELPPPGGAYSHLVEANGFVFTAGLSGHDPATGKLPAGIRAQTDQVIRNLETALGAVGLTLADVVKTTVHLANLADFGAFNGAYRERFPEPYPVRTTVGSQLAGILVEIDAVAARPAS